VKGAWITGRWMPRPAPPDIPRDLLHLHTAPETEKLCISYK
jgi:hypothetical protein